MVAVAPRSPIGYNSQTYGLQLPELRLLPDLPSATIKRVPGVADHSCGCSPISHRLQFRSSMLLRRRGCGCSPISHRLQLTGNELEGIHVAVAPRSPIGYNKISRSAVSFPSCGCSPISHRLQFGLERASRAQLRLLPDLPSATINKQEVIEAALLRLLPDLPSATMLITCRSPALIVAVAPRSPIGYNSRDWKKEPVSLRLLPDLPSATIKTAGCSRALVAVAPRSPIGYNYRIRSTLRSSCGCSPISHRLQYRRRHNAEGAVAVAPRSPIGYNLGARDVLQYRCGCSPISHRLQYNLKAQLAEMSCGCSPISHRLQCGQFHYLRTL